MSSQAAKLDPEAGASARLALEDSDALARLRQQLFESVGPAHGRGILYSLSYCEGMIDGLRVMRGFSAPAISRTRTALLPIVFHPEGGVLESRFGGSLRRSLEAELHQRDFPPSSGPVCFVSEGYAAGWYSAILGETILVREASCTACGDASCRFEARPAEDWLAEDDAWAKELLPFLDLETISERAEQRSHELEQGSSEGDMLGAFDPMSPAVHVWGPVLVLPYSGPEDGLVALDAVREDVGRDQIRVVVVDLTGAMIDPVEAVGLTHLLHILESSGVEAVVVGIDDRATHYFQTREGGHGAPLMARDLSEAIALGFQLSQSSRVAY